MKIYDKTICKPTADDIKAAIRTIAENRWIDTCCREDEFWHARVFDPRNVDVGNGSGTYAAEAMAMAWICSHDWDALIRGYVEQEPEKVPLEVPDDWRFEVSAPTTHSIEPIVRGVEDRREAVG